MRRRRFIWILLCLLCATGAWLLWQREGGRKAPPGRPSAATTPAVQPHLSSPVARQGGIINTNPAQISVEDWNTNRFAGRLRNTPKPLGQLVKDSHAILLENALIDTREPLHFVFPKNLQLQGDPHAYIVQANGPIGPAFRAMLAQAGATVVSYIPNNAYLVRAPASVANTLGANPLTQAVVPYEPYYKIQSSLLYPAVNQIRLADGEVLNLALFRNDATATIAGIEKLGGQIVGRDQSPFGPVVRVIPPRNWTVLATLSGVQIVELVYQRATANDLSRATMGVAADSLTATNYLGLTGSNIIVAVDDTGIDANHPDLGASAQYGRTIGVIGAPAELVDTDGHGTHVAGIIAGDGEESDTVTNASGSTLPGGKGANYQFRGMAPGATLYALSYDDPDQYIQEAAAQTNALISNNSWVYEGDSAYDLAAASYDAATRDALPLVTGSQPVLFVFAAGNAGNGIDNNATGGGTPDSIESPATAKNVITVGALQEQRNITATVTNADGTTSTPWADETSTSYRVAGFSSRGNTGIGTEGNYGRYKPDVCAPGTFIISDRSEQWDINSYFYQNPTNHQTTTFSGYIVQPGSLILRPFPSIPPNTVQLTISTYPNADSPYSFAYNMPTFIGLMGSPGFQYISTNDPVVIPGTDLPTLQQILSTEGAVGAFNYAISNNTENQVIFDLETDIITTNGSGNYFLVLSNLDQSIGTPNPGSTGPGPYYRYETGTSMSAAAVSGMLALMQEFYANAYGTNPSPAMLKAMLINGAQVTSSSYDYNAQNTINYEGWGLVNLPDSVPLGITNQLGVSCSTYVQDQSPTNALATGDSQTYYVANTNALPLRVTLAWTDPPGDPAAAIKLVNNLVLVVTNYSNPTNPIVYYGNDIPAGSTYNTAHATNTPPVFDSINNVQNVNLQADSGTNFSVTVMGYRVNVNAVSGQTNNVVQDYALVISTGVTNSMTVTATPVSFASNPTGDQQITYPSQTPAGAVGYESSFAQLLNQVAGANSPLLGTNTLSFSDTTAPAQGFSGDWQVTVGQTNQWHFYVVTNVNSYSNAAFVIFNPNAPDPNTLSVPRMGVFAGTVGNATREADIDLYVTTDPSITNLNPAAISNCVVGTQIGADPGPDFAGASLGRGTTEFVVDTNSQSRTPPGPPVYYVGVKSEDQMSAEYGFISIFSAAPFSTMNSNGVQTVFGVPRPMGIPDGSPTVPGKGYIFGLAIYPQTVGTVTVSNEITHQNFGDLIGTLTLNGHHPDVLNNHDSFGNPPGPYYLTYDDSAGGNILGSRPSDGPGNLNGYIGQQALGVWMLNEVDDSLTQTGRVDSFTVKIQPHQPLNEGEPFTLQPGGWFYDYIDVPPGATNLTIYATNITPVANPPLEMYVKYGSEPTTNDFDRMTLLNNLDLLTQQWGSISIGPPLASGRYFVGIFNPPSNPNPESGIVYANYYPNPPVAPMGTFTSTDTPKPILDDAVTYDSIYVPSNQFIYSLNVGLAVQHPRISDLVFHLISPDGTRVLLMENRGGTSTDGAGSVNLGTNALWNADFEGEVPTNYSDGPVDRTQWSVSGQVSVVSDPTIAADGSNFLALANGTLSTTLGLDGTYSLSFADRGPGIAGWWRGEGNATDSSYALTNGNNGVLIGRFTFPAGEVGQAFQFEFEGLQYQFAGTNTYVQIPQSPTLDVGRGSGFTVEGWINPTNITAPMPLVEWLAPTPADVPIAAGPFLDRTTGHYYYLLGSTNWTTSEAWAEQLGGHLATVNDANEENWIYDTFARYGGTNRTLWIGLNDAANPGTYVWADGTTNMAYTNWLAGQPVNCSGSSYYTAIINPSSGEPGLWTLANNNGDTCDFPPTNILNGVAEVDEIQTNGVQFWMSVTNASVISNGCLYANIVDTNNVSHEIISPPDLVVSNRYQHVALTYDRNSGLARLYYAGTNVATTNLGVFTPKTGGDVLLGRDMSRATNNFYAGDMDEMSIYGRRLSDSEIAAIADNGSAGKFDPAVTPPESLAEAYVTLNGTNIGTVFGQNTQWQTTNFTFTATAGSTLEIQGVEPGLLLDRTSLSAVTTNSYNYLMFTEDTNQTTTPIKFAAPPYIPLTSTSNPITISDFESTTPGDYTTTFNGGSNEWTVLSNQVSVVDEPLSADPGSTNFLALANGEITSTLPTVAGHSYVLTFRYRGPGLLSWWRGETNTTDALGLNNGLPFGALDYTNGEVDQAFHLDGTSAYVLVPDAAGRLNFDVRYQRYTVAFWVNLADVSSRHDFMIDRAFHNVPCSYDIYYDPVTEHFIANCWDGTMNIEVPSTTTPVPNTWYHLAATFNSPAIHLFVNGTSEMGPPVAGSPETIPPGYGSTLNSDAYRLIGRALITYSQQPYYTKGELDEVQVFGRVLSDSEIKAIYSLGTNGSFDPVEFTQSPSASLAKAQVSLGGVTYGPFFGDNNNWRTKTIAFTANQDGTPLQITGIEPGMLLDSFTLAESAGATYYLPEESLDAFDGENAQGTWTLEIQDDRAGATNPPPTLLSWLLQLTFQSSTNYIPAITALTPQSPSTNTVPPGGILYYSVFVPSWVNYATNLLVSADNPVSVLFNQTNLPTGGPADTVLINNQTAPPAVVGNPVLSANPPSTPPLVPGQTYYLAVTNSGTATATVALEVDFDITVLTNNELFTDTLTTNDSARYFAYDVGSNAVEATFQLLKLSGNADLVVSKGTPLPTLFASDYGSFNATNEDENIYVLTSSSPVPLSPGRWYLGVFNRDDQPVTYTVLAKELDTNAPPIIDLSDNVPFHFTMGPGAALTNFFRFTVTNRVVGSVTNYPQALRFELYNLNGNGDLTVQPGLPPFAPPFFQSSQQPGVTPELIIIHTNDTLPSLAADWYLGVPNHETNLIHFTILASIETNLVFPSFPGAEGAGAGALGGRGGDVYHVLNLNDGGPGSLRYGITNFFSTGATALPGTGTTNPPGTGFVTNFFGARTIVFDVSGTIDLLSPLVISNSYLTIAGQTAPGDGITIKGDLTTAENAHDVVMRYLRFRPGDTAPGNALQFTNVTESLADHISASWSTNALLSVLGSSNVTVQWSILADSLNPTNTLHGYGSRLRYGGGTLSFHHNLYADNYSANPELGDNLGLDFVNNVIYDWGIRSGFSTNDLLVNPGGSTNELNYVGNYLIAGPDTAFYSPGASQTNFAFYGGGTNTWIFQTNNFIDSDTNRILNGANTDWAMFTNQYTRFSRRFPWPFIATDEAFLAYEKVLDFAGASLARDAVDTNIVGKVRSQTGVILSTNGNWPVLASAPAWRDSDHDGIPDFWEITFGQDPAVPSNNLLTTNVNYIGYSDLEEYLGWLAGPHALTVTNTPVSVDLKRLFGRTGNLSFTATNAFNGTVYLTNVLGSVTNTGPYSNSIAVFTPTPNYSGYASFDAYVTNNNTYASFGPETVSVVVSAVGITNSAGVLTNGVPETNSVPTNSIVYYLINVPTNALFATNRLLFASAPVNLWFSGVGYPTGTNIGDYNLLTNSTGGSSVLSTTSVPTNIVQGGTYYLGVQNLGGAPVNFGLEVDFYLQLPVLTNVITGPTITQTNISGTNGFLLQWSGPTNYQYTIQWTTNLAPPVPWNTVQNPVINVTYTPTNGDYSWFDDGTLAGGFPPQKFYRVLASLLSGPITTNAPAVTNVIVAGTVTPLTVSVPADAIAASNFLVSATGPVNVWFSQTTPFTSGTNAGDVLLLSSVTGGNFLLTGSSTPPLVPGADYYLGLQNTGTSNVTSVFQVNFAYAAQPTTNVTTISTITVTNIGATNGILLTWFAPTNYRFQVQWTTNLLPGSWQTIPGVLLTNLPSFTPTNGIGEFQYFDDGTWTGGFGPAKFYRLIAYPPGAVIPSALVIDHVLAAPGGLQIQWSGPTNYQYEIQWTTNVASPMASWNVLTNLPSPPLTYSSGVFTFTDDGTLTGGSSTAKFFRVLEWP